MTFKTFREAEEKINFLKTALYKKQISLLDNNGNVILYLGPWGKEWTRFAVSRSDAGGFEIYMERYKDGATLKSNEGKPEFEPVKTKICGYIDNKVVS